MAQSHATFQNAWRLAATMAEQEDRDLVIVETGDPARPYVIQQPPGHGKIVAHFLGCAQFAPCANDNPEPVPAPPYTGKDTSMLLRLTTDEVATLTRLIGGQAGTADRDALAATMVRQLDTPLTDYEQGLIARVAENHAVPGEIEIDTDNVIARGDGGIWVMGWFYQSDDGEG